MEQGDAYMNRILVIEDEPDIQEVLRNYLQASGYAVLVAGDGEEGLAVFQKQAVDLVLLDVMLPDGTGFEFCMELREKNIDVPIIFLTAVAEEANIVQGLELGADDYVTKPYRVKELLARVAVNIRRYTQAQQTSQENSNRVVTFGNTIFDGEAFVLTQHGEKLDCTTSELRLLRFLLQHRGQVISRSAIMEQLYDIDGEFFEDNTLSVYIKRLRQKLGEDGAYIETVRGMGYRFQK